MSCVSLRPSIVPTSANSSTAFNSCQMSSSNAAQQPYLQPLSFGYPYYWPTNPRDTHVSAFHHDLASSWLPRLIPPPYSSSLMSPSSCPDLDYPSSPTDSCSSASVQTEHSPMPSPHVHVVCDVPLVVPKPRPYRCLTPIKFELPSEDQDLSHPPYTYRSSSSSKRKRAHSDEPVLDVAKRRLLTAQSAAMTPRSSRISQRPGARSKEGKTR